jgi:hypothetical protein
MIDKIISLILMKIFLWSGTKLFPFIDMYNPDDDNSPVKGMAFCASEKYWEDMKS